MADMKWRSEADRKAEQEAAKLARRFTWKTDIWSRMTDDEAERFDGALQTANVRQRRMWDDCQTIEHTSDLFSLLSEQMAVTFGDQRADTILAPSTRGA